jgi:hypothetical protein
VKESAIVFAYVLLVYGRSRAEQGPEGLGMGRQSVRVSRPPYSELQGRAYVEENSSNHGVLSGRLYHMVLVCHIDPGFLTVVGQDLADRVGSPVSDGPAKRRRG